MQISEIGGNYFASPQKDFHFNYVHGTKKYITCKTTSFEIFIFNMYNREGAVKWNYRFGSNTVQQSCQNYRAGWKIFNRSLENRAFSVICQLHSTFHVIFVHHSETNTC